MTPSDQTKLTSLKAALRRVIETKATPGPWKIAEFSRQVEIMNAEWGPVARTQGDSAPFYEKVQTARFIALSRQLLPSAAQVIYDDIKELELELHYGLPTTVHRATNRLHSILTAFPDEI